MTFKVLPQALYGEEGQHSSRVSLSIILWWSYYLLHYPSIQKAKSKFNMFIDLFDIFTCFLSITYLPPTRPY